MDVSRTRALRRLCAPVLVVCLALVAGCTDSASPVKKDPPAVVRTGAPKAGLELQSEYQRVVRDVLPSVVQIQAGNSLGSGVVYDGKGHIVTNAHVVGNEKRFQVTAANSETALTAGLVFSYPEQDLAVIKLDNVPPKLKVAAFGNSARVEVGQIVLAMGSPLGLSSSVTQGIVSATGRTVSEGNAGNAPGATIPNMVQTSAAINPGNSGGALVNLNSQVIGIPTLAALDPELGGSAAPGIGFAIPASMVKTIADQIVRDGKVTNSGRAALNITGRTVLDGNYQPAGVAVVSVKKRGAADKAGLQVGDIIVKLGDRPITTITSLAEALASERPGQRTTVTFLRNGSQQTVEVTLGEQ
ncbi:S1C family serine protease [Streptomyces sp. TP-A0356]|uniref:S1C family serine protease n=1 Tax=Streptomyces sp. TP-A0356 TaxID=1359208 RepID=UPI0006E3EEBF|nr:trypsin-like peptidase domain-containing protein [Streptomyces sp. TP-A0356]